MDVGTGAAALSELIGRLPEELRRQALTHASWTEARTDSYERLALLGDSVLGLSIAAELHERFPDHDAGSLTKILNQAVSGVSCAVVGEELGIPEMLLAAEPAELDSSIPARLLLEGERPLPEVTEAMIGACFVAFGFGETSAAVAEAFGERIEFAFETRIDFKSALQEHLARSGRTVEYLVVGEEGPPHQRVFEVSARVEGEELGRGQGRSKKAAGQDAAASALESLGG